MSKPWSITTTIRNPERIQSLISTAKEIEGFHWNNENQELFQVLLIKNRLYGFGSTQFYNGLPEELVSQYDDINTPVDLDFARKLFELKNYVGPDMRGRQSMSVLKKFGFVDTSSGIVRITPLGKLLISTSVDLGDVFLRTFIKWQLPNPISDDYSPTEFNIVPFIATLHLIKRVNELAIVHNLKPRGISRSDFRYFVMCLCNYQNIEDFAQKIINLRKLTKDKSKKESKVIEDDYYSRFLQGFLGTNDIGKMQNNLKDYADNTLRYFRLTRLLHIRGNGYYIDLEPRREIEINSLLDTYDGSAKEFTDESKYINYLSSVTSDVLPWETVDQLREIYKKVSKDVIEISELLGLPTKEEELNTNDVEELRSRISVLRSIRRDLQELKRHKDSQYQENLTAYIQKLSNIYEEEDKPLALEKYTTLSLHALNDAEKIMPNYPVGDDNEPTFTAPAGKPDIECYYSSFNAICEVTMLNSRDQWYNEGQPVMRHLRDFENKLPGKESYCVFIAPSVHRDTLNTFWNSVKYEFEGRPQKIVPLTISNFNKVMETLLEIRQSGKHFKHTDLKRLYDSILEGVHIAPSSEDWYSTVPNTINTWRKEVLG